MKREHSRKPDELYDIVEACSPGPYLELFARHCRRGWRQWGEEVVDNQAEFDYPEVDRIKISAQAALFDRRVEYASHKPTKPSKP